MELIHDQPPSDPVATARKQNKIESRTAKQVPSLLNFELIALSLLERKWNASSVPKLE